MLRQPFVKGASPVGTPDNLVYRYREQSTAAGEDNEDSEDEFSAGWGAEEPCGKGGAIKEEYAAYHRPVVICDAVREPVSIVDPQCREVGHGIVGALPGERPCCNCKNHDHQHREAGKEIGRMHMVLRWKREERSQQETVVSSEGQIRMFVLAQKRRQIILIETPADYRKHGATSLIHHKHSTLRVTATQD
uniref:Uncharacterized protein n=1 Tax=Oryza rufipogon TaxID=4529 RepID=A0A0E0P718_ORYRU